MGRGQFEEILEDCLSALLEGRRTIEESLSLYPAWRGRLEPLLRAARDIAAGLDEIPPPYSRERGLQRFLDAARVRRRLRQILPTQGVATPWYRWAPVGLSAVAVVIALALSGATLLAESDNGALSSRVSVRAYSGPAWEPAPATSQTSLQRVQGHLALLEASLRDGSPVAPRFLADLEEANDELAADIDSAGSIALLDQAAAVSAASRQYQLLDELLAQAPPGEAEPIAESLASAAGVLLRLGAPTPTPTHPPATPSPAASATATASPEPSPVPSQAAPPLTPTPAP
jgi:hypothetical protein